MPGTSWKVVTAASYITKGAGQGNLSTFSSRGPTRDGRHAPTLAAPGQAITSALVGAAGPSQYQPMSGTSVAAPHLTGVCALMLQSSPTLPQDDLVLLLTSSPGWTPSPAGHPATTGGRARWTRQRRSTPYPEVGGLRYLPSLEGCPGRTGHAFRSGQRTLGLSDHQMLVGFFSWYRGGLRPLRGHPLAVSSLPVAPCPCSPSHPASHRAPCGHARCEAGHDAGRAHFDFAPARLGGA
ncbi:S8 family serine peptidase [Streptomyces europaeiscabiei]|uniref:S8 family serine peptidase n=1 Tax=Streptomyces europaeiscabiei TaxID=146819 RepID=UPI0039A48208